MRAGAHASSHVMRVRPLVLLWLNDASPKIGRFQRPMTDFKLSKTGTLWLLVLDVPHVMMHNQGQGSTFENSL